MSPVPASKNIFILTLGVGVISNGIKNKIPFYKKRFHIKTGTHYAVVPRVIYQDNFIIAREIFKK